MIGSEQKRPGANRPPEFVPESPLQKGSLGVIFSPRSYRGNAHSKSANLREDTLGATCSAGPFCLQPIYESRSFYFKSALRIFSGYFLPFTWQGKITLRGKNNLGNTSLMLGCRKWGCNKWGFKGCLAAPPGNRPKSAFFALFLPFSPFSGRAGEHLENPENGGKRPFSSDILGFP